MPFSTIFMLLFYPYIAHERTAQNLILSVRSLSFALFVKERHRSQNQGSLKSKERLNDFKERCAQLCFKFFIMDVHLLHGASLESPLIGMGFCQFFAHIFWARESAKAAIWINCKWKRKYLYNCISDSRFTHNVEGHFEKSSLAVASYLGMHLLCTCYCTFLYCMLYKCMEIDPDMTIGHFMSMYIFRLGE